MLVTGPCCLSCTALHCAAQLSCFGVLWHMVGSAVQPGMCGLPCPMQPEARTFHRAPCSTACRPSVIGWLLQLSMTDGSAACRARGVLPGPRVLPSVVPPMRLGQPAYCSLVHCCTPLNKPLCETTTLRVSCTKHAQLRQRLIVPMRVACCGIHWEIR